MFSRILPFNFLYTRFLAVKLFLFHSGLNFIMLNRYNLGFVILSSLLDFHELLELSFLRLKTLNRSRSLFHFKLTRFWTKRYFLNRYMCFSTYWLKTFEPLVFLVMNLNRLSCPILLLNFSWYLRSRWKQFRFAKYIGTLWYSFSYWRFGWDKSTFCLTWSQNTLWGTNASRSVIKFKRSSPSFCR